MSSIRQLTISFFLLLLVASCSTWHEDVRHPASTSTTAQVDRGNHQILFHDICFNERAENVRYGIQNSSRHGKFIYVKVHKEIPFTASGGILIDTEKGAKDYIADRISEKFCQSELKTNLESSCAGQLLETKFQKIGPDKNKIHAIKFRCKRTSVCDVSKEEYRYYLANINNEEVDAIPEHCFQ